MPRKRIISPTNSDDYDDDFDDENYSNGNLNYNSSENARKKKI